MEERRKIDMLLARLHEQKQSAFPLSRHPLNVPAVHGVYIIRDKQHRVAHVGRTIYGKDGLLQRLRNHLAGKSSFVRAKLLGKGSALRRGYTYQYLQVSNQRSRLLLEYAATVRHCPKHLGVGSKSPQS